MTTFDRELRRLVGDLFVEGRVDDVSVRATPVEVVVSLARYVGGKMVCVSVVFVPWRGEWTWSEDHRQRIEQTVRMLDGGG